MTTPEDYSAHLATHYSDDYRNSAKDKYKKRMLAGLTGKEREQRAKDLFEEEYLGKRY